MHLAQTYIISLNISIYNFRQSSLDVRSKESLDFEVWKKLPVNVDLVDKELRSQKKRQFRAKYKTTITLA